MRVIRTHHWQTPLEESTFRKQDTFSRISAEQACLPLLVFDTKRDSRDGVNATRSTASLAMDRYASGDMSAFASLYDSIGPRIFRYLKHLSRSQVQAEDLLQQTFLKIHDARGRFVVGSDVEPWAYAIARRLYLSSVRRVRWEAPSIDTSAYDGFVDESDTEQIVQAKELGRILETEFHNLPPLQQEAFLLVREEGLSIAQAAEVLGVTESAIKLRTHRAYENFRLALENSERKGNF